MQFITDSLKYPKDQLFFDSTPQVPSPSFGSHDTKQQPLLHVSYLSDYLQLEFPESNLLAKH